MIKNPDFVEAFRKLVNGCQCDIIVSISSRYPFLVNRYVHLSLCQSPSNSPSLMPFFNIFFDRIAKFGRLFLFDFITQINLLGLYRTF